MSTQFSTLMALSAMQTQQSQAAVQSTLAERKRKEEQRKKEQEAREKKEKELETKLRLKHFEEERRERERLERKEKQRAAKEAEKEKREAAQRDILRYGPKKVAASKSASSGYPSVNSQTREELRKQRIPSDDEEEGGSILTREEKRQRRLQNDLFGSSRSSKRSGQAGGYHKSARRLPGGALDVTDTSSQSLDTSQSVKARLSAMPNTLTRLNVVKRDTRTIDEIVRDREREKERGVLNGDQAKEFHDWFGKDKKRDPGLSKKTGTDTPNSRSHSPASHASVSRSPAPNGTGASLKKNVLKSASILPPVNKNSVMERVSTSKLSLKSSTSDTNLKSKLSTSKAPTKPKNSSSSHYLTTSAKKRPRSTSLSSDSSTPPPSKRRVEPEQEHFKSEIWKLFGKDRSTYVSNYVDSDDEDMEADATVLEKEEMRSARIAREEDEAALRDEKLHEDEKRRKKLERRFSKLSPV